jgi:hypothetical protein
MACEWMNFSLKQFKIISEKEKSYVVVIERHAKTACGAGWTIGKRRGGAVTRTAGDFLNLFCDSQ